MSFKPLPSCDLGQALLTATLNSSPLANHTPVLFRVALSPIPMGMTVQVSGEFLLFFFFAFSGLPLRHMEVPRLGVESELQLLAYTTATATWDPSHVCDLHHSSRQHQIPDH